MLKRVEEVEAVVVFLLLACQFVGVIYALL